jgi:L-2-hydroxyglutarate oxidase LhgO
MPLHTTDALILRTYKLGESDRIVVFLTRDRGKKRGVAKNARQSRRRFGGGLEPMTCGRVGYMERERRDLVRANIYPVPDPDLPFLGMHLTRGIDGEVLLGPSALMVGARDAYRLTRVRPRDLAETLSWPGSWKLAALFRRTAWREARNAASRRSFVEDLRRFVPELQVSDVLPGPAGIRAQAAQLPRGGETQVGGLQTVQSRLDQMPAASRRGSVARTASRLRPR